MSSPSSIVGFHPDSATEPAVDFALALRIPFAVVVCCVFPSLFKSRLHRGRPVKTYEQFLAYLLAKDPRMRWEELAFANASEETKRTVIYMTEEDFLETEREGG